MSTFPQTPYLPMRSGHGMSAPAKRFVLSPPYVHGRALTASLPAEEGIPSIDEFLDRTPPIMQFAPAPAAFVAPPPPAEPATEWSWGGEGHTAPPATQTEPSADWQSYDWGSAAALANAPEDAAAEAWASTDWSEPAGSSESRQSAAEALARALDHIARRIRAGELRVPGPETVQDDAAIAATLATLLGIRR